MPVRHNGTKVDWARQIVQSWKFGEDGGYENLQEFLQENVSHYEQVARYIYL